MANVNGTSGQDLIHVAGDGVVIPPGYNEIALATNDNDNFFLGGATNGGGDDLVYGGGGIDTGFYSGRLHDYDIEIGLGGSIEIADSRLGAPDGSDVLNGVEKLTFFSGSIDVSSLANPTINTGNLADTVVLSSAAAAGPTLPAPTNISVGNALIRYVASIKSINLSTGSDDDNFTVGDVSGVPWAWTILINSSGNEFRRRPVSVDLGPGNDSADFNAFDPANPAALMVPDGLPFLSGASPVFVSVDGGNNWVQGPPRVPITVSVNHLGIGSHGLTTVLGGGSPNDWVSFRGLPLTTGNEGVTVNLLTGIETSPLVDQEASIDGIECVEGTRANDDITCDGTANIVNAVTGIDNVVFGDQEANRCDFIQWEAAATCDFAAQTVIGPGTGSSTVNITMSGCEGAIGSNFADTFLGTGTECAFGLGGNDIFVDIDMVGFSGDFALYDIVTAPDGSHALITDTRVNLPIGVPFDGTDNVSTGTNLLFDDKIVMADRPGGGSVAINTLDRLTGMIPELIEGAPVDGDTCEISTDGDDEIENIDITVDNDNILLLFYGVLRADSDITVRATQHLVVDWDGAQAGFGVIYREIAGSSFGSQAIAIKTVTLNAGGFDDTIDASGAVSNHRLTMNAAGGGDTLLGGAGADILNGGDGGDVMAGGANNDNLNGGLGNDTMQGGAGNDTYVVNSASDITSESGGSGIDTVLSAVNRVLGAGLERLTLIGTTATLAIGNELGNVIIGNAANNTLQGVAGADTMVGGAGNDIYHVDNGLDVTSEVGGSGTDHVLSAVSKLLGAGLENLTLTGTATLAIGNAANNIINGNASANTLKGEGGIDTMTGGAGNDAYYVDHALDVTSEVGGSGTDAVISSVNRSLGAGLENLTLLSGATLGIGNAAGNVVFGNGGANTLFGMAGNDTVNGGGGADRVIFSTALNASTNVDVVGGFSVVDDLIGLDDAIFTGLDGALDAAEFVVAASAQDASDRIIYNSATGALSFDADGTGAVSSAIRFATLTAGLALSHLDFQVV